MDLEGLSREVRVFVSSTFQDMQAERDELVLRVFPRLRDSCERAGLIWGEVDLRWGITAEDKELGRVLPICFEELERCAPFFLGILGDRYGWVPSLSEDLCRHPRYGALLESGLSATHLEHRIGAFRAPWKCEPHVYLRRVSDEGHLEARMAALREEARKSGLVRLDGYDSVLALGERIERDVESWIRARASALEESEELHDDRAQRTFLARSSRAYVPTGVELRLEQALSSRAGIVTVVGAPGAGKSALLARFASVRTWQRRRPWWASWRKAPEAAIEVHFAQASPAASDWEPTLERLARRVGQHVGSIERPLSGAAKLRSALACVTQERPLLLIIDGLDRIERERAHLELEWLPNPMPYGLMVLLSARPGPVLEACQRLGASVVSLDPPEPGLRSAIVSERLLTLHRKRLDKERLAEIEVLRRELPPAFLSVLVDELRSFGTHEELGRHLASLLESPDVVALQRRRLRRLCESLDPERSGWIPTTLHSLTLSRKGLSTRELLDFLHRDDLVLPPVRLATLLAELRGDLTESDGLLVLQEGHLRTALCDEFPRSKDDVQAHHGRLADYFASRSEKERSAEELPWQLALSHQGRPLVECLSEPGWLAGAWKRRPYEVRALCAQAERLTRLDRRAWLVPLARNPEAPEGALEAARVLLLEAGHEVDARAPLVRLLWKARRQEASALVPVLLAAAQHALYMGRSSSACRWSNRAVEASRTVGPAEHALALLGQATALLEARDAQGCSTSLAEARRLSERLEDPWLRAKLEGIEAGLCALAGSNRQASLLWRKEADYLRLCGDLGGLHDSLMHHAEFTRTNRRWKEARALGKEALSAASLMGYRRRSLRALNLLARIEISEGKADAAMEWIRKHEGLAMAVEKDHLEIGRNHVLKFLLFSAIGKPIPAEEELRTAGHCARAEGARILQFELSSITSAISS